VGASIGITRWWERAAVGAGHRWGLRWVGASASVGAAVGAPVGTAVGASAMGAGCGEGCGEGIDRWTGGASAVVGAAEGCCGD
jgi:hypothetical protein